ncbi:hypothetical protein [Microseira wollei]|nr:hypothetical protein [Microseira wollei]
MPTPQELQISCGVGVPPARCSLYLYSPAYSGLQVSEGKPFGARQV